jgi:hypothetical protein
MTDIALLIIVLGVVMIAAVVDICALVMWVKTRWR